MPLPLCSVGIMRIRTKRPTAPEPPAAAEVTTDANSRAPELRIRAFQIGFVGALGVLLALLLGGIVADLSTVTLYVALALFLSLGLDPVVSWLQRRGMARWVAILIVFAVVIGVFVGLIATIVPIVITETTKLIENWDDIVASVQHSAGAEALYRAEDDERGHVPRESAEDRAEEEQPDADEHDRLAPDGVCELRVHGH